MRLPHILILFALLASMESCNFLFGSKKDKTVDQIFQQGAIDPHIAPNKVGYVPILPVWDFFTNPVDVYVGYDEMVYVVDDHGLNVLDQKGTLQRTIAIPGAREVIQDRRMNTYVIGRVNMTINGKSWNLA